MVLPAPTPDDAPRESTFVDEIRRQLNHSAQGLLVLVDDARPERLRELVLGLLIDHPDLWVSADVEDIVRVPERTVMVLEPEAKDADFLNLNRPVFARRQLKVVLWCDTKTTKALATRAVDFFDWISHRHECPPGAALHGVLGLRAAAEANAPLIAWTGGDLEACFREAFPKEGFVRINAAQPYPELVEAVKSGGERWIIFENTEDFRESVVEQVLAETNRLSKVIARRKFGGGFPAFHGNCATLKQACRQLNGVLPDQRGRIAALTGLEPEALEILQRLVNSKAETATLERTLALAVDPGVALVNKHPAVIPKGDRDAISPPILRAMPNHSSMDEIWRNETITDFRHDLKYLLWHAIFVVGHASARGNPEEALSLAQRAVNLAAQIEGNTSTDHARALIKLANVLSDQGRFSDSDMTLEKAYTSTSTGQLIRPHDLIKLFDTWAHVLSSLGRYDEAEEKALRAVDAAKMVGHPVPLRRAERRLQKIRTLRQQSS